MGESRHRDRPGSRRHHPLRRRLCRLGGDLLPGDSLISRIVRSLTVGGLLFVRTFFYVTLCALVIHTVTGSLLGLSEHGGLFSYYMSEQYRAFVLGGRFAMALAILTLVSFLINFMRQLDRMLGPGRLLSLMLGRYHRPVAEERIFMFLDLNNSTSIAEALGPL